MISHGCVALFELVLIPQFIPFYPRYALLSFVPFDMRN